MKNKNFKKIIWVVLGNGTYSLFQWLTISLMTKLLGIESLGIYSSATAMIIPIITFFNLNIRAIQLTDVRNRFSINDFFSIRIITTMLAFFTIIFITFIRFGNLYGILITFFISISKLSEMISEVVYGQLMCLEKYDKFAISYILKSILSFMVFFFLAVNTKDLLISIIGYSTIWIVILIFFDLKTINGYKILKNISIDVNKIKRLTIIALPLGIVSTINSLYDSVPKLFIERYIGIEMLGIYSATSYITLVGGLFISGITLTFSPQLSKMLKDGKKRGFINRVFTMYIIVIVLSIIFVILFKTFGKEIVSLLYTEEFVNHIDLLILLAISTTFTLTARIFGVACTSAHMNKEQLKIAIYCLITLVILNKLLIPYKGIYGVCISILLANFLKNILLGVLLIKAVIFEKSPILIKECLN